MLPGSLRDGPKEPNVLWCHGDISCRVVFWPSFRQTGFFRFLSFSLEVLFFFLSFQRKLLECLNVVLLLWLDFGSYLYLIPQKYYKRKQKVTSKMPKLELFSWVLSLPSSFFLYGKKPSLIYSQHRRVQASVYVSTCIRILQVSTWPFLWLPPRVLRELVVSKHLFGVLITLWLLCHYQSRDLSAPFSDTSPRQTWSVASWKPLPFRRRCRFQPGLPLHTRMPRGKLWIGAEAI